MADGSLAAAVRALHRGGLVAYPTDTLLGLAASATRAAAVERLAAVKRRPAGQPISVAVSSTEELEPLAELSEAGRRFVRRQLPGPYTVLLRTRPGALAPSLFAPDGTIGLRVPDHPVARELARRAGPITATSANRHGAPSPGTMPALRKEFGAEIQVYLDGGPEPSGLPSTLVDLTGAGPKVRPRTRSGGR